MKKSIDIPNGIGILMDMTETKSDTAGARTHKVSGSYKKWASKAKSTPAITDKERAVKEWSTNEVENGMEYVAWCHYKGSSIETCDSDSEGAFKVYRRAISPDKDNSVQDRKDLLECEGILSSVVDFVNISW